MEIDATTIGYVASVWITGEMEKLQEEPGDITLIEKIIDALEVLTPLALPLDLWKVQNVYFNIGRVSFGAMKMKSEKNDSDAKKWLEAFLRPFRFVPLQLTHATSVSQARHPTLRIIAPP